MSDLSPSRSPRLKKALGQHHLVDGSLCAPLVRFLRPDAKRVVEIGPGGGVLTAELLAAGGRVLAWERDPEWAFELAAGDRVPQPPGTALRLVVGDALEIPWQRLPAPTLAAGNLPYNVATPLIDRVLAAGDRVPRAAFLVQREVAERLAADPGGRDYGALSVLAQARATVRLLGRVKAGSFRPPPKVDGAFVGFEARPDAPDPATFARLEATVHQAFSRRRKTLRNSLGAGWGRERAVDALDALGLSPRARAEELTVDEFRALAERAPA